MAVLGCTWKKMYLLCSLPSLHLALQIFRGSVNCLVVRSLESRVECSVEPSDFNVSLTFRHHASYIQDSCTATPQSTLFIYLVNKYI